LALDDVEIDPHAGQRREDVGEQDHAIGLEGVEGLHRDLVGEIGVFANAPESRGGDRAGRGTTFM
jgi:hypothetical protein